MKGEQREDGCLLCIHSLVGSLFAYGMAVRSSLEGDKYNFLHEWCDISSLLCMGFVYVYL